LKLGIDAAKKAGGVCEAVVCYSGDVANPKKAKYNLKYYLDFVDQLVVQGIHILGIKDMAGLLKPQAATMFVLINFLHFDSEMNIGWLEQFGRSIPISLFTFTPMILQE
jgi:pyruvate carboxylase